MPKRRKCRERFNAIDLQATEVNVTERSELEDDVTVTLTVRELRDLIGKEVRSIVDELASTLVSRFESIEAQLNDIERILTTADVADLHVQQSAKLPQLGGHVTKAKSTDFTEAVTEALKEKDELEKKKLNVILFNVPEKDEGTLSERNAHDLNSVMAVQEAVKTKLPVKEVRRIGRKQPYKVRPLVVKFSSTEERNEVLRSAYNLRDYKEQDGFLRSVSIQPDLTRKQQEVNKVLVEELKRRRGNGEKVIIRRGKVVNFNNNREQQHQQQTTE